MTGHSSNDPRQPSPGDNYRTAAPLNSGLQPDPELAEGPAGTGRIAIYAVAIVVLLGAVLFGLNSSPTTTATNPPAATADSSPKVRDVTPNRDPGTTTGAAPAQPSQPPQFNPTGTQVDQNKGAN